MTAGTRAGQGAAARDLIDVDALIAAYYDQQPDPSSPAEQVSFGTSGHRGSALSSTFNEAHVLAMSQAVCDHRRAQAITGPLFLGRDPHALSDPAFRTAVEVFAANGVEVRVDTDEGFTPTPAISHAILTHNRRRGTRADGVIITPSHNPPEDGGYKYNPPSGGPADAGTTRAIQDRANTLLGEGLGQVRRIPYDRARASDAVRRFDYVTRYVDDLPRVVDLEAVGAAGLRLGVDPLGGASVAFWGAIAERHGLDLTVVNPSVDPTFGFMTLDWDDRIRMDCSSPPAMRGLIDLRDRYDVAFGNDPDGDRHGIVTPETGLLNPNHYLAAAIAYLLEARPDWPRDGAIGKTLVSSSLIDRVVAGLGRPLVEVPVGFKWFVEGLLGGRIVFGGEESAGASFLRRDGTVWTTDKDGLLLCLLAAEMTARTGRNPAQHYAALTERFGAPAYRRVDAPATPQQKRALAALSEEQVRGRELAGGPIVAVLTHAPGNGEPIGGVKVLSDQGWFAARPSGTEDVYKIYAESFQGEDHLDRIIAEAQQLVDDALTS